MKHRPALLILLTTSLALAQTTPASTTSPSVSIPAPAALAAERELTRRALSFEYGPVNVKADLLVGQLPNVPLGPLPTVPSARLLGSVVRSSGAPGYPETQQLYYDSTASVEEIQGVLANALKKQGWTAFTSQMGPLQGGGFQAQVRPAELGYYRLEQQVTLNAVLNRVGPVTHVTLNLSRSSNLRQEVAFRERGLNSPQSPLPALLPPGGTTVTPGGSSGGGNSWSSEASLNSSLSAGQLLDAYGAELKAAGWTLLTRTESGKTLTSVWQFQDLDKQPQTGILTLRDNGRGQFSAQLISLAFRS